MFRPSFPLHSTTPSGNPPSTSFLLDENSGMGPFAFSRASTAYYFKPTFTRASNAYGFGTDSTIVQYGTNVRRYNYGEGGPTTIHKYGYYLEGAATNYIRNPRAEGSVTAGTLDASGGTAVLPSNWTGFSTHSGISRSITGYGVDSGIPYIEYRIWGTNSAGGTIWPAFRFEDPTQCAAAPSQNWVFSLFAKVISAPTISGIGDICPGCFGLDSSQTRASPWSEPSYRDYLLSEAPGVTSSWKRIYAPLTMPATTAYAATTFWISVAAGGSVDITIRFGLPQLEQGLMPTSIILPPVGSPAQTTRAAETYTPSLYNAAVNAPRYDYDPATGVYQGILYEEGSTNYVKNSTLNGVGTSTPPTGWAGWWGANLGTGITATLSGGGFENGMRYMDFSFSGTPTTGNNSVMLMLDSSTYNIPCVSGDTWTISSYGKLLSGTIPAGYSFGLGVRGRNSAGTGSTEETNGPMTLTSDGVRRSFITRTMNNASTARVDCFYKVFWTTGTACNFSVRVYAPQLEKKNGPTSYIPTPAGSTVTRAPEYISDTSSPSFYGTSGTMAIEYKVPHANSNLVVGGFSDGTANNAIVLRSLGANTELAILSGGSFQANSTTSTAISRHQKAAIAWSPTSASFSFDGNTAATGSVASSPSITKFQLGYVGSNPDSSDRFSGWIRSLYFTKNKISDSVLPAISVPLPNYEVSFSSTGLPNFDPSITEVRYNSLVTTIGEDGLMKFVRHGLPRFVYSNGLYMGLLSEQGSGNQLVYSRDFQTSSWTKTNMTATKNQVGMDGISNSACLITATANNATISQSITLASNTRIASFYAKRVSGTGNVDISIDGGTTWTTQTPPVNGSWYRMVSAYQTLTNPVVMVRISNSGDSIVLDCGQLEGRSAPTSYIPTWSSVRGRDNDFAFASLPPFFNSTEGAIVSEYTYNENTSSTRRAVYLHDGSVNNRIVFGTATDGPLVVSGNSTSVVYNVSISANASLRWALGWKANNYNSAFNGSLQGLDTSGAVPVGMTTVVYGASYNNSEQLCGTLRRVAYYYYRVPDAALASLT